MNVDANQIAALEASIVGARQSGDKGYEAHLMEELAEARIPDGDDLVENWAYSGPGLDFEREAERRREDAREGVRRIESAAVRAYLAGLGQSTPAGPTAPPTVGEIRDALGGYGWVCTDSSGPVTAHYVSFEGVALCGNSYPPLRDRNAMGEYRTGDAAGDCPKCARRLAFELTEVRADDHV